LIWAAGAGLIVAVAVDTLAMIGRQLRVPLVGSIELVEAAVLFAAVGGLIVAALDSAHARVNLILARMPARWRSRLEVLHAGAAAAFYLALLAGSAWIAFDLWPSREQSELLHIPYRPLRLATVGCLTVLAGLALRALWRRQAR
jgi:TRAP-type C4-dicarboxylate transport system permease small subunit